VPNNLNPKFTTPVVIDFFFEVRALSFALCAARPQCRSDRCVRAAQEVCYVKFEVLDVDKTLPTGHVSGDDLVRPRGSAPRGARCDPIASLLTAVH